jgi:hypothetical protein
LFWRILTVAGSIAQFAQFFGIIYGVATPQISSAIILAFGVVMFVFGMISIGIDWFFPHARATHPLQTSSHISPPNSPIWKFITNICCRSRPTPTQSSESQQQDDDDDAFELTDLDTPSPEDQV